MENPTFAELKAGLQMPFRVSLVEPPEPQSHIIGLNIRGQFYSDLWLSLSPHCNALIGVKGSGKTSVLECLRFALGSPVPSSRQDGVSAHLQSILGPAGTVRVLIKRKDGAKIIVERSSSSQTDFKLSFDDNRQAVVQNPDALMFPSYILGWHEIEQAATDPNIRQVYLDTIAGREQIRQLQEKADTNANQIRSLHGQVTSRYTTYKALNEQIARLEDLRSGLKELDDAQLITLRDSYEVAVRQREAIKELKRTLQGAANNIEARSEAFNVRAEASVFEGASPLSSFAEVAVKTLSQLGGHLATFVGQHRDQLLAAAKELEDKSAQLDQAFDEFAKTYTSSVKELPPDKQRLLESYRQVMEDTKALPRLHAEMASEKAEIDARLTDLGAVCNGVADALDAQTNLRQQKVSELNAQLEVFGVRLQVAPLARRSAFDTLRGQFAGGAAILDKLNDFASGERRHHRRLARAYESLRQNLLGELHPVSKTPS